MPSIEDDVNGSLLRDLLISSRNDDKKGGDNVFDINTLASLEAELNDAYVGVENSNFPSEQSIVENGKADHVWSYSLSKLEDEFIKANKSKKEMEEKNKKKEKTWPSSTKIMHPPPCIPMVSTVPSSYHAQTATPLPSVAPVMIRYPPRFMFNNPNPVAQAIPLRFVTSSLMRQGDISYILYSLFRAHVTDDYYFIQYLHRASSDSHSKVFLMNTATLHLKQQKKDQSETNQTFRKALSLKSKEWTVSKQVLGRTVKTDITRPKPLLEIPLNSLKITDEKEKQNQYHKILWKHRFQIDLGYQLLYQYQQGLIDLQQLQSFISKEWKNFLKISEKGRKLFSTYLKNNIFPLLQNLPFLVTWIYETPTKRAGEDRLLSALRFIILNLDYNQKQTIYLSMKTTLYDISSEKTSLPFHVIVSTLRSKQILDPQTLVSLEAELIEMEKKS